MTNVYDTVTVVEVAVLAFDRKDVDAIVELFVVDCVLVSSTGPLELHVGRDAVQAVIQAFPEAMPDVTFALLDIDVDLDGGHLSAEFLVSGTPDGQTERLERRYRLSDELL